MAIATLALEYERQKGKDLARAAKEKAFSDKCEREHQVRHESGGCGCGVRLLKQHVGAM